MERARTPEALTAKYALLQGGYWMAHCGIYYFAMEYFLAKGFTAATAGLVLALSSIFTSLLQPVLAAAAERRGRPAIKTICLAGTGLAALLCLATGFLRGAWAGVVFCALAMILQGLLPFLNSMAFAYINRGHTLNYGLARATGSALFALVSMGVGVFAARLGGDKLPFLNLGFLAVLAGAVLVLGAPKGGVRAAGGAAPTPLKDFLPRYRRFCVLLGGLTCLFFQHSIINSYLTQVFEGVGGDSVNKGVGLAIAAIAELPTMGGFALLARRFSVRSLLRFAVIFMTVKAVWFALATSVGSLYLAHVTQLLGYAIYIPASVYYVNRLMAERDRVKGLALINVPMTLGSVFGTLLGGWLLERVGVHSLLAISAAISALGAGVSFFCLEKPPENPARG